VSEADGNRGSLQYFFPGGKDEIVSDAVLWSSEVAARRVRRGLEELTSRTPSALLGSIVDSWRRELTRERFSAGCPLVATAADTAASSEQLRKVVGRAFDVWLEPISTGLVELGVPVERSKDLAMLVIAALEGAIVLARVRRDLTPFDVLIRELGPVLDGAARAAGSGTS
jgi:hypothetical protein